MEESQPDAFRLECPTRHILARIAEKWTVLTLSALQKGPLRFGQLHRQIEGVSQKMLTKTLRNLEKDGILTRTVYDEMPLRVEYNLTPLGKGCAEQVDRLKLWVEENMSEVLAANQIG